MARSSANAGPTSDESSALRSLNSQDSRKRSCKQREGRESGVNGVKSGTNVGTASEESSAVAGQQGQQEAQLQTGGGRGRGVNGVSPLR